MTKILVLGAGSWGRAVGFMLAESGHEVHLWHYMDEELEGAFHQSLSSIGSYDFIFIAIPTQNIRENLERLGFKDSIFVTLSKGIEISSGKMISQILEEFGIRRVVSLYGPTHSDEILKRVPSMMVASSNDLEDAKRVKELFKINFLKVYLSDNLAFSELMAAMKNVYAIAYGILEGLGAGGNSKAALLSYAMIEIESLSKSLGIQTDFTLPNAVGDLVATMMKGRNRRFGELIAKGFNSSESLKEVGAAVEGFGTNAALREISLKRGVELRLNNLLYSVLNNGAKPETIYEIFEGEA